MHIVYSSLKTKRRYNFSILLIALKDYGWPAFIDRCNNLPKTTITRKIALKKYGSQNSISAQAWWDDSSWQSNLSIGEGALICSYFQIIVPYLCTPAVYNNKTSENYAYEHCISKMSEDATSRVCMFRYGTITKILWFVLLLCLDCWSVSSVL